MQDIFISMIGLRRSVLNRPPNKTVLSAQNERQFTMWYHHQQKVKRVELLLMEKKISKYDQLSLN